MSATQSMSASSNEKTSDDSTQRTFEEELELIQDALNHEFSIAVGNQFIATVEEEEFDRDGIVDDIKDGLSGDDSDSNLLTELNFTDPEQRLLFCALILNILNVKMEQQCNAAGEGEGDDVTTPTCDYDYSEMRAQTPAAILGAAHNVSLEEKDVMEMDAVELSKLAVSHLQQLKVPEVDQSLLVDMLSRRGYTGHQFSCLLTERRSELNFCKLLKKCNVPMGKAKEVFKTIKIRVQMEQHYRLPSSTSISKRTTTGGAADIALPAEAFEQLEIETHSKIDGLIPIALPAVSFEMGSEIPMARC